MEKMQVHAVISVCMTTKIMTGAEQNTSLHSNTWQLHLVARKYSVDFSGTKILIGPYVSKKQLYFNLLYQLHASRES